MKKFFLISLLLVFSFVFTACSNSKESSGGREEFPGDGSEEFVTVGNSSSGESNKGGSYDEAETDAGDTAAPAEDAEDSSGNGSAEREIVESDIYKFDGNVLWLANQYKGLIAVDISDPENLKILDTVKFKGYVGEMYLQDGRAYVLVSHTNENYDNGFIYYYGKTYSKIIVVDTTDPKNLAVLGEFEMDGAITDSRQVGDVIYVAATEYIYRWYECDGEEGTSGNEQTTLVSINIKDPKDIKIVDKKTLDGYSYTLYVSQKSIYVAEADTYYWNEDYKEGYPVTMFDISDPEGKIVKKAEFRTEGFMSDRWKMHETGDKFFAVSSSSSWGNGDSFIESFDISDPENVKRLDKLIFMTDQQLYGTKFEGDRMYAVTYFQQDPLHVIDISDPANLKQLGELEVPGWSDFIEVRGTTILAVGRDGNNSKISMYNVADPENPKEINTVSVGSQYSYSEANYDWKAFKIFDDLGLILLPLTDYGDSWETLYKLYLVDFDLDKGLKTRGFIASDSYVRRGVAIQDLVFSIGENHVVLADAADRDKPKILSELTLASYVSEIAKCGKSLCGLDNSKLTTYDEKNLESIWESSALENPDPYDYYYYGNLKMVKNSKYAYIFNNSGYYWWDDEEAVNDEGGETGGPKIKIIKFNDNGKFEEIGDFPFTAQVDYYNNPAVSENNILAKRDVHYVDYTDDDNWYSREESKITFLDMNKPEDGIKEKIVDFDYETLTYENNLFANGSTFWTSGCKLKKASQNGDQYLCYAIPFDTKDPSNPKMGTRVNIPGELVGISDNGEYLYTQTPRIYKNRDDIYDYDDYDDYYYWSDSSSFEFYILKLNADKTAVKVVKHETMKSSYEYKNNRYESVSDSFIIKNNKVFLLKNSSGEEWDTCSYRSQSKYDIRLVSAETGKEIKGESVENASAVGSVKDGGLIFKTAEGLKYIDENGKAKKISESKEFIDTNIYNTQFLNGKIYIPAGWDGFYSLEVK